MTTFPALKKNIYRDDLEEFSMHLGKAVLLSDPPADDTCTTNYFKQLDSLVHITIALLRPLYIPGRIPNWCPTWKFPPHPRPPRHNLTTRTLLVWTTS